MTKTLGELEPATGIPVGTGYCACGCGERTKLAAKTRRTRGHVAGRPLRYRNGHNGRKRHPFLVNLDTGCWEWQAALTDNGYTQYKDWQGRKVIGHRFYYEQLVGPIPEGQVLHHTCENKRCVNPDHLEPLTPLGHTQHHAPRLTPEIARQIRTEYREARAGYKRAPNGFPEQMATRYGLARSTLRELVRGDTWREDHHGRS